MNLNLSKTTHQQIATYLPTGKVPAPVPNKTPEPPPIDIPQNIPVEEPIDTPDKLPPHAPVEEPPRKPDDALQRSF